MKNPWPYAIVAFFALAITGVAAFITFAMRHSMDLVRTDYYEHEIRFQEQIDRVARTRALGSAASITHDPAGEILHVHLPASHASAAARLRLYRPSDASLDRACEFQLGADGAHSLALKNLAPGIWRAQLSWLAHGQEYYLDREFIAP
jgi:hypothetical protein